MIPSYIPKVSSAIILLGGCSKTSDGNDIYDKIFKVNSPELAQSQCPFSGLPTERFAHELSSGVIPDGDFVWDLSNANGSLFKCNIHDIYNFVVESQNTASLLNNFSPYSHHYIVSNNGEYFGLSIKPPCAALPEGVFKIKKLLMIDSKNDKEKLLISDPGDNDNNFLASFSIVHDKFDCLNDHIENILKP